jgi:tetratricopeptide (TPR) repeat protein
LVALALALAASPPARAADLAQARGALERRDFAAALPLYEQVLALRPGDVELWIEAARASGFADRNAEAAVRYRRALELAPQRRADVLPALAWQTLWAGDAAGAAPLFDEVARTGADLSVRADALDGLGQARDALGLAEAAITAWRASLGLRPAQAAVERRLARALLWRDRHAEADALLTQALARDPADRDSAWLRAKVWNFAGRHQDAVREFERLGGPRSAGERLDAARAWAWAGVDERALELLADPVDAELARESVETTRAVAERVQVDTLALGVDHRPHPRLTLTAGLAALRFDDGNRRQRATARAQWLLAGQPRWVFGVEGMAFHSERPSGAGVAPRGYWNPARYREARGYTALELERRPWVFTARLGLGTAVEVDGDGLRSHGQPHQWALAVGRDFGPQARLQFGVAGAGAGMGLGGGGSGYWRRSVNLSLHVWF